MTEIAVVMIEVQGTVGRMGSFVRCFWQHMAGMGTSATARCELLWQTCGLPTFLVICPSSKRCCPLAVVVVMHYVPTTTHSTCPTLSEWPG